MTVEQEVWLVIESTGLTGQAFLNDQRLGEFDAVGIRTEISKRLQRRNLLQLEVASTCESTNAAGIQSVRLEIEERIQAGIEPTPPVTQ
jgi:hypothetical protein